MIITETMQILIKKENPFS